MNRVCISIACMCLWTCSVWASDWQPQTAPLMTKWADDIKATNTHPEYPRPQWARAGWKNLNGPWDHAIQPKTLTRPTTWASAKILVPFPVESALSGVKKFVGPENKLWYRRQFDLSAGESTWKGKSVLLHFEAVDWETTVWVNGQLAGSHLGGYDPFTFEITSLVKQDQPNELVVSVWDPSDAGFQGRGKQVAKPGGIFYTPTTGIWQTVWLEAVTPSYIQDCVITPDLDRRLIKIQPNVVQPRPDLKLGVVVRSTRNHGSPFIKKVWFAALDQPIEVSLAELEPELDAHVWSPEQPHLIDLRFVLTSDARSDPSILNDQFDSIENAPSSASNTAVSSIVDQVTSYTALRKISLGKDSRGVTRIQLNNKPYFQFGPLDQGFWPDGLYTAPTDEALKFDIEQTKAYGFNMIRKHVKVEPDRWYYFCDKLGLLVWQDMPSGDRAAKWDPFGQFDNTEFARSAESAADYRREWKSIIDARRNHPSIVMWVPFNEGWGQSDTVSVTNWTKQYDPSRLVNCASGGNDFPAGDVIDAHRYPGPFAPVPTGQRASVLGEFGGLGLPLNGHTWQGKENWGYVSYPDQAALTDAYVDLVEQLPALIAIPGLSAAVYTQTTDVETEVNGLMTYDRKVLKVPVEVARSLHAALHEPAKTIRTLLPTSQMDGQTWKYTVDTPAMGWEQPEFDASAWKEGIGGFGEKTTPGAVVRTDWKTNDIWLRRSFQLDQATSGNIRLVMHHDEDAEVYFNGVLATKVGGWANGYRTYRVSVESIAALKQGRNTLAVHCRQTGGGQYIDVGITEAVATATK